MIQQINNNSIRCAETPESDMDFLRRFYAEKKQFSDVPASLNRDKNRLQ